MLKENVDFVAVFAIALVMLGFAEVRSWQVPRGLDMIRVENAIDVDRCPITQQVLSNLNSIFH
jgi:hypothetical protein